MTELTTIPQLTAQIRELCDQIDAEYQAPPPATSGCYFGYFGDNPTIVMETRDHANLTWAYGWPTGTTAISVAQDAKAAGNKVMLGVYGAGTQQNIEDFLALCAAAGVLDAVVALYPMDEPDVAGMSEAEVVAMVHRTQAAAAKFPAVANVPIAVFYGPGGKTPGISEFDWVGRDNYGAGPQELPLEPGQRLMTIAGGASPWKESPDRYVSHALGNHDVIAVIGFIWQYPDKPPSEGIKGNGMAPAYRAAGQTLTGRGQPAKETVR